MLFTTCNLYHTVVNVETCTVTATMTQGRLEALLIAAVERHLIIWPVRH